MKRKLLWLSMLALFNLMCGFISAYEIDKENFTQVEPTPNEFAGKYLPSKETIAFVREKGQFDLKDSWIELSTDGMFEMRNVPNWWRYANSNFIGKLESGKGEWELTSFGKYWRVMFDFKPGETSIGYSDSDSISFIEIGSDQPPYTIWFYVGDPDHGDVMIYEQVIETP